MPAFLLPFLQSALSGLWSLAKSRVGQIIIAFVIAWIWSSRQSDDYWRSFIAAEQANQRAVYQAEVRRQEAAARDIAKAATARAEEDAAIAEDLRRKIEAFDKQEKTGVGIKVSSGKVLPCSIDDDFAGVVRSLDAPSRKSKAAKRTR